jgi:hypothetical protein
MKKISLVLLGYVVGLGALLVVTIRTLLAVGTQSKSVTVAVNRFGEQYLDLVCLVFLWGICVAGLYFLVSYLKKERSEKEHDIAHRKEAMVEKPEAAFAGISDLPHEPSTVVVSTSGEPLPAAGPGYSLLEYEGTGTVYSVSVNVLTDDTVEQ